MQKKKRKQTTLRTRKEVSLKETVCLHILALVLFRQKFKRGGSTLHHVLALQTAVDKASSFTQTSRFLGTKAASSNQIEV